MLQNSRLGQALYISCHLAYNVPVVLGKKLWVDSAAWQSINPQVFLSVFNLKGHMCHGIFIEFSDHIEKIGELESADELDASDKCVQSQ